jgi:hypothetical protein
VISAKRKRDLIIAAGFAAMYAAGTVAARRMGYSFGRDVVVRCRAGHVFSTVWIPGASLKALRLGLWRVQWCPVGKHVALVRLLKDAEVTDDIRELAAAHHDLRIP